MLAGELGVRQEYTFLVHAESTGLREESVPSFGAMGCFLHMQKPAARSIKTVSPPHAIPSPKRHE